MDLLTEIRRAAVTVQRIGQVTLLRLSGGLPPGKKPETDAAEIRALAGRVATRGANGSLGAHQLVELPPIALRGTTPALILPKENLSPGWQAGGRISRRFSTSCLARIFSSGRDSVMDRSFVVRGPRIRSRPTGRAASGELLSGGMG